MQLKTWNATVKTKRLWKMERSRLGRGFGAKERTALSSCCALCSIRPRLDAGEAVPRNASQCRQKTHKSWLPLGRRQETGQPNRTAIFRQWRPYCGQPHIKLCGPAPSHLVSQRRSGASMPNNASEARRKRSLDFIAPSRNRATPRPPQTERNHKGPTGNVHPHSRYQYQGGWEGSLDYNPAQRNQASPSPPPPTPSMSEEACSTQEI